MDCSEITKDIFIGTRPSAEDYARLRELGVRLVINMRFARGPYPDPHETPLTFVWLHTFDSVFIPIPIGALMRGARAALKTIQDGGKVYVHCAQGRHSGPAMGAAILIAQGYEPQAAMQLIKTRRAVAEPEAFYIRRQIMAFAREWQKQKDSGSS